jgi:hypothetical protein
MTRLHRAAQIANGTDADHACLKAHNIRRIQGGRVRQGIRQDHGRDGNFMI